MNSQSPFWCNQMGSAFLATNSSTGRPSIHCGRGTRFCLPLMKIVMYFRFRSRRARFSAAVRFMGMSRLYESVACRSALARSRNLDDGVALCHNDSSRPLLDDESCSINREAGRPLDGKSVRIVDDAKWLRFAVPAEADGKVILAIQQPNIARPSREEDQVPQGHDARIFGVCELRDLTDIAADIEFDGAGPNGGTPFGPVFALTTRFPLPLGLFAFLLRC